MHKRKDKLVSVKPYDIVMNAAGRTAEITMYGEVVEKRPTDWWTGKPIAGNFIILNEFLKDLEKLADCTDITIRINSPGGNMNAGVVIYNRLREMPANITTINDGLAASAASIIYLAGDVRKMHPGSIVMIHGASILLYDYVQEQDALNAAEMLKAHNQAGINIYVERTGKDEADLRQMMAHGAEGWFTGQQAVDEGFATEVITDADGEEPVSAKMSPDRTCLIVGGRTVAACLLGNPPDSIPCMTADEYAAVATTEAVPAAEQGGNNSVGGKNEMYKTVEELRAAQPELVAQIENAAVNSERLRIQGIDEIQNVINDDTMVHNAKFGEKPMNAAELLLACAQAHSKAGTQMFNDMKKDADDSGASTVTASAAPPAGKSDDPKSIEAAAAADVANFYKNSGKEVF